MPRDNLINPEFLQQDIGLGGQVPVQPAVGTDTGGGYGELNPIAQESQAEGVIVESPQEQQEVVTEYGISEEKLEEIRENITREIERADNYYEEEIEPNVIKRHKVYESDATYYRRKYPNLTNISDVTASDFHDTVEWAIPSLIKVFFGNEDICKLQGANSEQDEKAAAAHSELIKYQLERCNDGFLVFYDWIKNSLIDNLGIVKCYWEREQTVETKSLVCSYRELMQLQMNPRINILSVEEKA